MCFLVYAQFELPALHPAGPFPWVSATLLLVLAVLAEVYMVRTGPGMEVSACFLTLFLSGAVAGPLAAFGIGAVSQLVGLRRHEWERTLCFSSTLSLCAGVSSSFYWVALSGSGGFGGSSTLRVAAVGLVAGFVFQLLNYGLAAPVAWLRRGIGPRRVWRELFKPFFPFEAFFLAISLGLVSVYHLCLVYGEGPSGLVSTLLVLLCLLPVFGLIYAFRAYCEQRQLATRNAQLAVRNERLALQSVASQITALDLKDDYTARHSAAVALWATDIAEALELDPRERNMTHLAGLLHDIGKIGVPDEVLRSPGRLDAVDWDLVESHCYNGYRILCNIDQFRELATVVLHHHERFDGTGYPRGLSGGQIPLISRIICVADSYSAMTSSRPYGPALSFDIAMAELDLKKGTQFDPEVVDCFVKLLSGRDERYRRGEEVDFNVEVQQVRFLRDLPPEPEEEAVEKRPLRMRARLARKAREGGVEAPPARDCSRT